MTVSDQQRKITEAIAYGWDGGKARAFEALSPYVRHIGNCGAFYSDDPRDERCICGLRRVWSIHETAQSSALAEQEASQATTAPILGQIDTNPITDSQMTRYEAGGDGR